MKDMQEHILWEATQPFDAEDGSEPAPIQRPGNRSRRARRQPLRIGGKKMAQSEDRDLSFDEEELWPKKADPVPFGLSLQWPVIQFTRVLKRMTTAHRQFFRMNPEDLKSVYMEKARQAEQQGNLRRAVRLKEWAVALDPKDAETLYELGLAYEKSGNHDDALKVYQKVTAIQSDHAKGHYRKGFVHLRKQEFKEALKAFEIAQKIEPNSEHLFYRMGQAFDRMQKHDKAIAFFRKAVEVNRDFLPAYKNMALTYDSMNRHKEALECLKRALELEEMSA
jgi:tetratricopeptide (TPR) repeat protein